MRRLDPRSVIVFFVKGRVGPLLLVAIISSWILILSLGAYNLPILEGTSSQGEILTVGLTSNGLMLALLTFLGSIILPALFVISLIWAWLQYLNYRYELAEEDFRKEEGVIAKKYVSIPYEQVQNVDVYRDLWHRLLGLSEVQIQTAGMSDDSAVPAAEGELPGLASTEAENVRQDLIHRASISQ